MNKNILLVILIASFLSCSHKGILKKDEIKKIDRIVIVKPRVISKTLGINNPLDTFKMNLGIGEFFLIKNVLEPLSPVFPDDEEKSNQNYDDFQIPIISRQNELANKAKQLIIDKLYQSMSSKKFNPISETNINFNKFFPSISIEDNIERTDEAYSNYYSSSKADNSSPMKFNYIVEKLTSQQLQFIKKNLPNNNYILFSWIESFYIHNYGRFWGREESSPSGARVGILVCIYDIQNNEILFTGYENAKKVKSAFTSQEFLSKKEKELFLNKATSEAISEVFSDLPDK